MLVTDRVTCEDEVQLFDCFVCCSLAGVYFLVRSNEARRARKSAA